MTKSANINKRSNLLIVHYNFKTINKISIITKTNNKKTHTA